MEKFPLLISAGSLLLWAMAALFWPGRAKTSGRGVGLALALIQLGSAIWGAARVFGETSGVHWRGTWFRLGADEVFEIGFTVDQGPMVMWLTVSFLVSVLAYFGLLAHLKGTRPSTRSETAALPLLALGALFCIASANFTSFYFGWSLVAFVGFMAVGFSATARDERARASFRYVVLNIIPEMLFAAGVLGCYASAGTLGFAELNEKGLSVVPHWAVVCLVLGAMLRNMQVPLMQCARYVALARTASYPVLFVGHAALAAIIFAKLHPLMTSVPGIEYLAILPAVTAVAAAALALPEEDPAMLTAWLVTYVAASTFLSGLAGDFQASQALAYTGVVAIFFLANASAELDAGQAGSRWLSLAAACVATGTPISGWGWARYLEYVGLMNTREETAALQLLVFGLKVLADIMMGLALWAQARERWLSRDGGAGRFRWDVAVPLILIGLASLAVLTGGRPFGGLAGSLEFEYAPGIAWFESSVSAPGGLRSGSPAAALVGTDVDIVARVLSFGVFALPLLLGTLWLFREKKGVAEFRAVCARLLDKLGRGKGLDSKLWDWFFDPVSKNLGRAASYFDSKIVDFAIADAWAKPARWVRSAFAVIESSVLDRRIVDGVAEAVSAAGRYLRLAQNGQVQFYFAIGLILMGAIVIKFVIVGG